MAFTTTSRDRGHDNGGRAFAGTAFLATRRADRSVRSSMSATRMLAIATGVCRCLMEQSCVLQWLSLSCNHVGLDEASSLANSLVGNSALTELRHGSNDRGIARPYNKHCPMKQGLQLMRKASAKPRCSWSNARCKPFLGAENHFALQV